MDVKAWGKLIAVAAILIGVWVGKKWRSGNAVLPAAMLFVNEGNSGPVLLQHCKTWILSLNVCKGSPPTNQPKQVLHYGAIYFLWICKWSWFKKDPCPILRPPPLGSTPLPQFIVFPRIEALFILVAASVAAEVSLRCMCSGGGKLAMPAYWDLGDAGQWDSSAGTHTPHTSS